MADPWAVPGGLTDAERRAWFALQAWQREFVGRDHQPWGSGTPVVDPMVGVAVARGLPGPVTARLERSLSAVNTMLTDPALTDRVRGQHRRVLGHEPTTVAVGALDLQVVDRIAARGAVGRTFMHAGVGGVTGSVGAGVGVGVAGVATGGLAVGAAVGVMAMAALADATYVVLQASRTTARTAAAYGFDPRDPDEQAAVLAVVGAALARRRDRAAALDRSHHVAGLIADRFAHGPLAADAARALIRPLHGGLVLSLSGQQVRRGVPVLGAVLGSTATARTGRHVEQVARQLYRDRFLRRRATLDQFAAGQLGQVGAGPPQSRPATGS